MNALRPDVPERFARDRRRKLGLDHFGIGFDRYQWVLRIDRWTAVLTGRFDPADVVDTLLASGYGRAGTHHGVALLAREDGPRAVAVADGALAWSSAPGGDPPVGAVRALFDAKAGRVPRYHETDEGEGFATLTEATGGPLVGRLFVDAGDLPIPGFDVEGVDGWGTAVAFDGATTYLRTVVAFDRPKDPETVRLKLRSGAAGREFYRTADAVDVTADERSASVVAAVADERYADLLGAPETDVTYPQVTWGYDRDPAADEVTVTHRGGDEVPAGSLRVTTPAVPDEPSRFADEYDAVGPGDSLAVAVPPSGGGRIRILWSSSAGARRSVLDRYEVPGDDQSGTTE
ncbi:hypothetical protein BRD00_13575 [Halobacteriales archaeon QS_8_69_26]|nr:MAG: hypothetical protein BRD00_13575 [Halobacteriales archaeon QS_8_69_26]